MQSEKISTFHVTMDHDNLGLKPEFLVNLYLSIDSKVKQLAPNGNPTSEYLARLRMKDRVEEQRARNAAVAAKREAHQGAKLAECEKSATATACKP